MQIAIEVLDGTVRCGEREATLSDGEFRVLVTLALTRRPPSAGTLAELLWPDADESAARNRLNVTLHRIRARLGRDAIRWERGAYAVAPDVGVDLPAVERALLDPGAGGVGHPATPLLRRAYAAFVRGGYRRLAELERYPALERRIADAGDGAARALVRGALARGDVAAAVEIADGLLAADPCSDEGIALALRCCAALGAREAAARRYREYRDALRRELDTAPEPPIRGLAADLLGAEAIAV